MVSTRSKASRLPLTVLSNAAISSESNRQKPTVSKRRTSSPAKPSSSFRVDAVTKPTSAPAPPTAEAVPPNISLPPLGTITKSNWCLRAGLDHCIAADKARASKDLSLASLISKHGPPSFYKCLTSNRPETPNASPLLSSEPTTAFQSLCRIVAGQQLAGAAAQAIWKRLLAATDHELTPRRVLDADLGELQTSAGLSGAKARSIHALAQAFDEGRLSDEVLVLGDGSGDLADDTSIRSLLLPIKGIGPWSCDMYLMFSSEHPNVLPLGDLGVRKGLARYFGLPLESVLDKRKKGGSDRLMALVEPYRPYLSLLSYYMWKVADAPAYNQAKGQSKSI